MDEMTRARAETIVEMSDLLVKQTLDSISRHGTNDPTIVPIIMAAYSMAIKRIDELVPGFQKSMSTMLVK